MALLHGFQYIQTINPHRKQQAKQKARQNPAPRQTQHLIRQANPASTLPHAMHPASDKQSKPSTQARQAKKSRQSFALVSDTKKAKKKPSTRPG